MSCLLRPHYLLEAMLKTATLNGQYSIAVNAASTEVTSGRVSAHPTLHSPLPPALFRSNRISNARKV